jgi:hypothetical protein
MKRIPLLAVMMFALPVCIQMHAMVPWEHSQPIQTFNEHERVVLFGTDPHRLEPLHVEPMTEEDRITIEDLKKDKTIATLIYHKNYTKYRTVMAQAGRQQLPERDTAFIDLILQTALFMQDGHLIADLIKHGIDPNASVDTGLPTLPLFKSKTLAMTQLLVSHGASLEAISPDKNTILHRACEKDISEELLHYYLQHSKINVDTPRASDGATPLKVLLKQDIDLDELERSQKKVSLLVAAKATINTKHLKILHKKIDQKQEDAFWASHIKAYSALAAQISDAMCTAKL